MSLDLDHLFIDGELVVSHGQDSVELENPADLTRLGSVPVADAVDVDRAVASAKAAFPGWSQSSRQERAELFAAIAAGIRSRSDEFATLISQEMGVPIGHSRRFQVDWAIGVFEEHVDIVKTYQFEREEEGGTLIALEPAGVAAAITPWNAPLFLIACKVAPALAAGCTVVLKPSEVTSLSAHLFAEVMRDAGTPAGVFNMITGTGATTGDALVRHPDVAVVSFTGSGVAGEAISVAAAPTVKNVALELGGKSASIVFADADFETAISRSIVSVFSNSGQACAALTRLLVERSRFDEAIELAQSVAKAWVPGDPAAEETVIGPVATRAQFEKVNRMIEVGLEEGARLVTGGPGRPDGFERGYFVRPTILADVDPSSTVAQEEIFGPVLAVIPFEDEDDAVAIANGTRYGLFGAVWSGDEERALRVARRVETGMISVNGRGGGAASAPFGGVKQSGRGREWGAAGLAEYLETKSILH